MSHYVILENVNLHNRRMPSSGMWGSVDILLTGVSEECIASIFRE
jgi:hypothetical protein